MADGVEDLNYREENAHINAHFNPLEPFVFVLTVNEWLKIRPIEEASFNSDGRRCLQPGWTKLFEEKLNQVNQNCVRWYTGSVKKPSSRKHVAPFFSGRADCRNAGCSLSYRLYIENEPESYCTEVEVVVMPRGTFVPSEPIGLPARTLQRGRKRHLSPPSLENYDGATSPEIGDLCVNAESFLLNPHIPSGPPLIPDNSDSEHGASCSAVNPKEFLPPFIKKRIFHPSAVSSVSPDDKCAVDLLYYSLLKTEKQRINAEKEKIEAETVMLRVKTEQLMAKKVCLETKTSNLLMERLKLKHELHVIGIDVEIVNLSEYPQQQQQQFVKQDNE